MTKRQIKVAGIRREGPIDTNRLAQVYWMMASREIKAESERKGKVRPKRREVRS